MKTFNTTAANANAAMQYAWQQQIKRGEEKTPFPFDKIGDKVTISAESRETAALIKEGLESNGAKFDTSTELYPLG